MEQGFATAGGNAKNIFDILMQRSAGEQNFKRWAEEHPTNKEKTALRQKRFQICSVQKLAGCQGQQNDRQAKGVKIDFVDARQEQQKAELGRVRTRNVA